MSFEKRVCVLKQVKKGFTSDGGTLSGAVYCERLGEELTVMPRMLGIAPVREGRYALALWIDGQVFSVELKDGGSVRLAAPSIKGGMAVLLVFVRGEAVPVAFGSCGAAPRSYEEILAQFNAQKKRHAEPLPPTELPAFSPTNVPLAPTPTLPDPPFREDEEEKYDDEAIANANYYGEGAVHDDGAAAPCDEKEAGDDPCEDGETVHPFRVAADGLTYYDSVRDRLAAVFEKYERDERLTAVFPRSEWVKLDDSILGIVYEGGRPKYLCVAVEANGDPPEEMKGICTFVPEGPFSDMGGFYIVFQSASTGEYVRVENG